MSARATRIALITGGAGFIGSNLAERLLHEKDVQVRVFDNFSRRGVVHNLKWLRSLATKNSLEVIEGDVREGAQLRTAMAGVTEIYHLAAQVAVTTSIEDPISDFEVNARGTLNVLEAARVCGNKPFVLYTSTNKVYGALHRMAVEVSGSRYHSAQAPFHGINEQEGLDLYSPYGCSKGAADQYVRDYARIYDLPTVVFRMSCIAGPRQFGNEDQGWVAHFLYSILNDRPVTIYGNGFQVRDVLHVQDLIDAMQAVRNAIRVTQGEVYNIGGGIERSMSVVGMLHELERRTAKSNLVQYKPVRAGDQPLYISDVTKLQRDTGWRANRALSRIYEDIEGFWYDNRDTLCDFGMDAELAAQGVA